MIQRPCGAAGGRCWRHWLRGEIGDFFAFSAKNHIPGVSKMVCRSQNAHPLTSTAVVANN